MCIVEKKPSFSSSSSSRSGGFFFFSSSPARENGSASRRGNRGKHNGGKGKAHEMPEEKAKGKTGNSAGRRNPSASLRSPALIPRHGSREECEEKKFRKGREKDALDKCRTPEEGLAFSATLVRTLLEKNLVNASAFDASDPEALAVLPYDAEIALKQEALKRFWKAGNIPGSPGTILPAPMPRHYRALSKRSACIDPRSGRFSFVRGYGGARKHLEGGRKRAASQQLTHSLLEPEAHGKIYDKLETILNLPRCRATAEALNYCIIRGAWGKYAVIFNTSVADGQVVGTLKRIAERLKEEDPGIIGCFMYLDETRSEYYLESRRPEKGVPFKKLCGTAMLDITIRNRKFLYPPTVFSQINEAMLPLMVNEAFRLLNPDPDRRFLDLYCGYGLFGLLAAEHSAEVIGMDAEGPAIEAASANAVYHFPGRKIKFIASSITGESLERHLPRTEKRGGGEIAVLDPPRKGTAPGVLERLVARRPFRVLHIFCGTDMLPRELGIWKANGYSPVAAVPLDLFPGTMNLETLVLLERKRS